MVLNFEQEKELEQLKHQHKKEFLAEQFAYIQEENRLKLLRLDKILEITKAGGKPEND